MPKHKTSISISDKTLKFLTREGWPTSTQLGLDADLLAEIFRLVDSKEGECPLGRNIQSLRRSQGSGDG